MGCVGGQRCSTRAERRSFANGIIGICCLGPWRYSSPAVLLAAIIVSTPSQGQEIWPTSSAWTSVTPGKAGMDPTRTAAALKYGRDRGGSGILVRAGQRVGTWGSQTTNYILRSSTKSFGAVLLGLALKDGKLGLDTAVQPILPELGVPQSTAKATAWLSRITVRHLATHTSGFDKPGGIEPVLYPARHRMVLQRRRRKLVRRSVDRQLHAGSADTDADHGAEADGHRLRQAGLANQCLIDRTRCAAWSVASSARASRPAST